MLAGALALLTASSARAQTPLAAQPPGPADAGQGLLGQDFAGFEAAYIRHNGGAPAADRDCGFVYNKGVFAGLDATASWDWLTGGAHGDRDWREQALFGATGYLVQPWGRPFAQAEAGWAWDRFNLINRNGFSDRFTAGIEFQPAGTLSLAPYARYEEWHRQQAPGWGDHAWDFGLKAACRLSGRWSLTVDPQIDQFRNLTYAAGLVFRF